MRRTLKRGVHIRSYISDDERWLWAAYKRGMDLIPDKDLDQAEFQQYLNHILSVHDVGYSLHAHNGDKMIQVGLALGNLEDGIRLHGHMHFYPWATKRNKLEVTVKFFQEMRQLYTVIFMTNEKLKPFFDWVCRYGILRRVGFIENYTAHNETAHMYQTKSM